MGKSITVKSENGPKTTVIDCEQQDRGVCFDFGENSSSIFDGFSIINGSATGYWPNNLGGGIYCEDYASPIISNCIIQDNNSHYGGGIYIEKADASIINCKIISNSTIEAGGGILCDNYSSPTISDCLIIENTASTGGGISCGLYSSPIIYRCEISDNVATRWDIGSGGGISCIDGSSPEIRNCLISRNEALGYLIGGGGIECSGDSYLLISNCIINGNYAFNDGGGIFCKYSSDIEIRNSTVYGNTADGKGDGLYSYSAEPSISNCIFWGNGYEIYYRSGVPEITFSDVQGGWPGEGNIDAFPRFVTYLGYDFLLHPFSPCIDTGDPEIEDFLYDWHPRIPHWYNDGPRSDMGVYGGPGNIGWFN